MGIAPAPTPTPLVEPAPVIAQLPSALEEVVRLTQSGMTDAVVMAYIENHPDPFYPTA